ncbi:MAG TPA: GreA/GreB family elongation factor [Solirubrobacter sp.]|nr:GreA/GreB family elongation factor [Solirubrobacter sp.]
MTHHAAAGLVFSPADYENAVRELESLRSARRAELATRLREAQESGSPGDQDDRLDAVERIAVYSGRIAQLERQLAAATILEATTGGGAGLGDVVQVRDQSGREASYEIVGRRSPDAERAQVTPSSPVGEALLGARAGDSVTVTLPDGRSRTLDVLDVRRGIP